ncbi:hypothetical protein [Ensifer sp. 4252]|uniref:hypothetical protein n=1 Tax=Ensifer sp. 4252 TaxID=3373915 RepID=UPI003D21532F
MDYAVSMLVVMVVAVILGSAVAYGIFTNRRCDAELKLTKQDKSDETAWRREFIRD